jgi:hypothetical protein
MIPYDSNSCLFHLCEEEQTQFFAEIAHKMKNKLGGIHGFTALLEKDLSVGDPKQRLVKKIQDGILQLNSILIDFMKLFQKSEPQLKSVDIVPLLQDGWHCFWDEHSAAGQSEIPSFESLEGEVRVITDPELTEELFMHLCSFAWCFSKKIEKAHLDVQDPNSVQISLVYCLPQDTPPKCRTVDVHELILNAEPFEARLSLAIATKCQWLLNGTLVIHVLSHYRRRLTFQLNRGI